MYKFLAIFFSSLLILSGCTVSDTANVVVEKSNYSEPTKKHARLIVYRTVSPEATTLSNALLFGVGGFLPEYNQDPAVLEISGLSHNPKKTNGSISSLAYYGYLGANSKINIKLKPGRHHFAFMGQTASFLTGNFEAGKTYYARAALGSGAWSIRTLVQIPGSLKEAQEEVENCRWVKAKDDKKMYDNMIKESTKYLRENINKIKKDEVTVIHEIF